MVLIKKLLKKIPNLPGIYLMYNSEREIIYIGKAKNLQKRLTNYSNTNLRGRISRMVHQIHLVEYQITGSEAEALLVEAKLIKEFQPRFNILLRKDKSATYIKLRLDHNFPQLIRTYNNNSKNGKTFGPFTSGYQVNLIILELQKIFKLRSCNDSYFISRNRPCLEYEINKCFAPCMQKISQEDYSELVDQVSDFLSGNITKLLEKLVNRMNKLSNNYFFEEAAIIRDKINFIKHSNFQLGQRSTKIIDADVITIIEENNKFYIQVLLYRGAQEWGNQSYSPIYTDGSFKSEVLEAFIGQFYQTRKPPKKIIINCPIPQPKLIIKSLENLYNIKTKFVLLKKRASKLSLKSEINIKP